MEKCPRFRRSCLYLCLILAWLPVAGAAASEGAAAQASREAMADAISRMMAAMGMMGADGQSPVHSGVAPSSPATPPLPWPAAPLESMAAQALGENGVLEGLWEGNDGSLLIVQGPFYRIYAPGSGVIDGAIQVASPRVRLTNPQMNYTQEFEYALDQGRLALRSASGRIFLYRRLVLHGGGQQR